VTQKVTPKGDLSWYLKWIATAFILTAITSRAFEISKTYDIAATIIGSVLWCLVAVLWRDRSIFVLNSVVLIIMTIGLITN
jgi:hypothetical protein